MKRPGRLVAVLLCVVALTVFPASAGSASGVCTTTWTFTFAAPITNNSGPTPFSYSASGMCQTTAQPSAFKSVGIGGSGPGGLSTKCALLQLNGTYVIDFAPDPAPLQSIGQLNFWGTASGGAVLMQGENPTFRGVATLAGGGIVGCSNNGAQVITFTGVLAFVDP